MHIFTEYLKRNKNWDLTFATKSLRILYKQSTIFTAFTKFLQLDDHPHHKGTKKEKGKKGRKKEKWQTSKKNFLELPASNHLVLDMFIDIFVFFPFFSPCLSRCPFIIDDFNIVKKIVSFLP